MLFLATLSAATATGRADVVVMANRSRVPVAFRIDRDAVPQESARLLPGETLAVSTRGPCDLTYDAGGGSIEYRLDANAVYLFVPGPEGTVAVSQVDLGGTAETGEGRDVPATAPPSDVAELPVKVLVDNHELTRRDVWEPRLRKRIAAVSDVLEQTCRVRLKIVAVEQWESHPDATEFSQALDEFRRRVDPQPGALAVGFTGRYRSPVVGQLHLGGTPGLLQTHVLVREWSATMSEPEREEVLLHELGHYLGAVHSPEPTSVMRPVLADKQAIRTRFRIGFDPVNTLLMNLIGEEIRLRQARAVSDLTEGTRRRLGQIYGALAAAVPDDNSARQYQYQVGMAGDTPLSEAVRDIVTAVRDAARQRQASASAAAAGLRQDRLTEHYVRRAAEAAGQAPQDVAPVALLLGLGIALDDSPTLLENPLTRELSERVETPDQRRERRALLSGPTLVDRRDLAQHFFLSAYLTAVVGAPAAEAAGLAKELTDARQASGFSYIDLAANLAGIAFAERLLRRELPLAELARRFRVADVMPDLADLPEGLRWPEVQSHFTTEGPETFVRYRDEIRSRIARLRTPR
jgi:hypothetical protein